MSADVGVKKELRDPLKTERRRVHTEQLMNHGSLLVRISLEERLKRKEWVVPHMVEHSRSYHGLRPWTSARPDTGFVRE